VGEMTQILYAHMNKIKILKKADVTKIVSRAPLPSGKK
jgi:hypothetical protein